MTELKKVIGFIVVEKKDNLYEIVNIRKYKLNIDLSKRTDIFYNNTELDHLVYKLCKEIKPKIIIEQIDDNKDKYIINDKLIYITKTPLTTEQILNLTTDFKINTNNNNNNFNDIIFILKNGFINNNNGIQFLNF